MVIKDWDKVVALDGFPRVNRKTYREIFKMLAVNFGPKIEDIVSLEGFNIYDEDDSLLDWEVDLKDVVVEYNFKENFAENQVYSDPDNAI